jgi:hypothetical protein
MCIYFVANARRGSCLAYRTWWESGTGSAFGRAAADEWVFIIITKSLVSTREVKAKINPREGGKIISLPGQAHTI